MAESCCGMGGAKKKSTLFSRKSKRVSAKKKDAYQSKLKQSELEGSLDSLAEQFGNIQTVKSAKTKAKTRRATMGMSDMLDALLDDVPFAQNPFRRTGMKSTRRASPKRRTSVKSRRKKYRSPLSGTRKRRYTHVMKRRMGKR